MERLPYIDEHARCVGATPERTWAALIAVGAELHGEATGPLARLTRLELEEIGPDRTRIRAQTRAVFPGALGRVYRALVIGTGVHRMVVRRLLRRIEGRACLA